MSILRSVLAVSLSLLVALGGPLELGGAADAPMPAEPGNISMSFNSVALKDVLVVFSQQSGMNFVASDDVENKKITVYFENVPVRDALESILKANSLIYDHTESSNIYIVKSPSATKQPLVTRVFRLKYARFSMSPLFVGGEKTISNLEEESGVITTSSSSSSSSGSSSSSSSGSSGTTRESKKGIDKVVEKLLSSEGKVAVDVYTNSLIVTDTEEVMKRVETVIAAVDKPSSQVVIEVYVMEVRKDALSDVGVEWGGDDGSLLNYTGGSRLTSFPFGENVFTKSFRSTSTANDPAADDPALGRLTLGTLSAANFQAVLHLVLTDTDTRILANPRVLTLNNEAAKIKLVTNAAIARQQTQSGSSENPINTETAERTEIGISLQMTPQIYDDGSVGLFLEPAVTTVAESAVFPGVFLDPTTRAVRTMARVRNHETLVLGGLIDTDKTLSKRKIPLLGDIPGIGMAFRYDSGSNIERELLIFMTPHIVDTATGRQGTGAAERDVAMVRMLDQFKDRELKDTMQPLGKTEKTKADLMKVSAVRNAPSAVDREMVETLDYMKQKGAKLNQ